MLLYSSSTQPGLQGLIDKARERWCFNEMRFYRPGLTWQTYDGSLWTLPDGQLPDCLRLADATSDDITGDIEVSDDITSDLDNAMSDDTT